MRDFWMPFAPTILDSWAPRYIKGWKGLKNKIFETSKYMITAFDTTTLAQSHLKAAMHQKDKTIRPQILSQSDNPDMYKLLKYYQKLTNMGGLMNTSFNLHGYPLATTLKQALFTFKNSDLKYLTIEDYLIQKQ
jgi:carbamoyltransferase